MGVDIWSKGGRHRAMQTRALHLIYFTATETTSRVVRAAAHGFQQASSAEPAVKLRELNVTSPPSASRPARELMLAGDEAALFAFPVYAGRIPRVAAERLARCNGNGAPAAILVTYGNRDYEDALLELFDLATAQGFLVKAAGTFVAQHSIFQSIAKGRPDVEDLNAARAFGAHFAARLEGEPLGQGGAQLPFRGERPFRKPGEIPLFPRRGRACDGCNLCAEQCPAGAIAPTTLELMKERCLHCARCIGLCPRRARSFPFLPHAIGRRRVAAACGDERKNPEWW